MLDSAPLHSIVMFGAEVMVLLISDAVCLASRDLMRNV